jgi:dihydrofolate reductase
VKRKGKTQEGEDFTTLDSGSIMQQFAKLGLIDEYQLVIVPVVSVWANHYSKPKKG